MEGGAFAQKGKTSADPLNLIQILRYNCNGKDYLSLISNIDYFEIYGNDTYINFGASSKDNIGTSSTEPNITPVFSSIWNSITAFSYVLNKGYTNFLNADYLLYHMTQLRFV